MEFLKAEKEYIEREAAKQKLAPVTNDPDAIDFWEWQCSEIDSIPAADVRLVVRGKWIKINGLTACSVCKENPPRTYHNFCPNCGADMREES